MKLHPADIAVWALLCLAEAVLAYVILKRGAARRWPFLLSIIFFDLGYYAVLATQTHNYKHYFYIYWFSQGLRSLLSLGLLWDVGRSLPALKYVPKNIGLMLLTIGFIVTVGSVYSVTQSHPKTYPLIAEILMIRECVTVLWMCCAATLLGSVSFLGIGWSIESVKVTSGFLVSGLAAMLAASFTSSWPQHGYVIDKLQTCIEIVVFFSWGKTLFSSPDAPLSDSALNVCNEH